MLPSSFGRAASCDVTVPNVHYSGTHCVVSRGAGSGGVCVLRNLSSNGTFRNDRQIEKGVEHILRQGHPHGQEMSQNMLTFFLSFGG